MRRTPSRPRLLALPGSLLAAAALVLAAAVPAQAAPAPARPAAAAKPAGPAITETLHLPDGRTANVYAGGVVQLFSRDHHQVEYRTYPSARGIDGPGLPDAAHLTADLMRGAPQPFAQGSAVVVFKPNVTAPQDVERASVAPGSPAPQLTTDAATNALLGRLGVDRSERLFRTESRQSLSSARSSLQSSLGRPVLDFSNAYRLHVAGASVTQAVTALLKAPGVAYAAPDWTVATAQAQSLPVPAGRAAAARDAAARPRPAGDLPSNYAVSATAQSLLDTPSTNAAAAFDEVGRYLHQLPGEGEIVTNVSIGDLVDAGAANDPNDICGQFAQAFGPTTQIVNGQRFLALPSMPLIPTYTADAAGNLNGLGEVCGVDPFLGEVGLDFSVMSPLPHDRQRPGAQGAGLTDLLGIAPGASYRLVVPAASFPNQPTIADIDAALLGAARQTPRPDVITASLGFGLDAFGFAGRYLEDDPLSEAVVAAIVHSFGVVVAISANDGTRLFTNAAISPTGGAVATDVAPPGGTPTDLNDVGLSTVPSRDFDSGSIDVGGTTLDDVFAAPPQFAGGAVAAQHAYAETRWTGFTAFASGFGGRVNVSAPSDNVLSLSHTPGGGFDAVDVSLNGGTSASAPEVAAAAAVVLQAARLTHRSFPDAVAVRDFLRQTGDAVPQVPQADTRLQVGPQVNLGRAVETLLDRGGIHVAAAVARVAVAQRRPVALLGGAFQTDTNPAQIDLQGPLAPDGTATNRNQLAWITLAPDWEGLPAHPSFQLFVAGHPDAVLATTPWARLLPAQILGAAGLPLASTASRTVQLTYRAGSVSTTFSLTFGPAGATVLDAALAPRVPALVRGGQIPVTYDLTGVGGLASPTLVVSQPGRVDPATGQFFRPSFSMPLRAPKGTVQVPVSALPGGGVYGVGIQLDAAQDFSDFAFTRVAPAGDARPAAPLLAAAGAPAGHSLEIPFGGSVRVSWNVSRVPGATGAALEVSAPGPTATFNENTFNNPNGTGRDRNGVDAGSVAFVPLPGASGTVTLHGQDLGLAAAMQHVVRVQALRLGAPVGEAGDVSTITMDGVRAADGGFVGNGFGISLTGSDGYLTSNQQLASGQVLTSVDTFDRTTNATRATVASASNAVFQTTGWGTWGGDVGLIERFDLTSSAISANVLDPVAAGTLGPAWTPPYGPNVFIDQAAPNSVNADAAFVAAQVTPNSSSVGFGVFTSNLHDRTFGPLHDISATVSGMAAPALGGFGENPGTRTATAGFGDFNDFCGAPTIVTVDLATGATGTIPGVGSGIPNGLAVDPASNRAAVPTACSDGTTLDDATSTLGIYDLTARTATAATYRGIAGLYATADPQHGLWLLAQPLPADVTTNNNATSALLVFDGQGRQLASIERFNLFNTLLAINSANLQLDPAHRTGYLLGPLGQQLAPFSY